MISFGTAIVICAVIAAVCGLLIVLIKVTVKFITFIITNIVRGCYVIFCKIRKEMRSAASAEPRRTNQGVMRGETLEGGETWS